MKILIFGASGATGRQLVRQALDQRHQVTAFVRDLNKIPVRQSHHLLIPVEGNVSDPAIVQRAVEGQDVVLSALGANTMFAFDPIVVEGLINIIRAMEAAAVPRLIYLSTLGVRETRYDSGFLTRNLAPTLLRTEVKGHEEREKLISQSNLEWQIVRAPVLTNGPVTKAYRWGEKLVSGNFAPTLSRADVAHFMLSQVIEPQYIRKAVCLLP